jgi:hypothetical protein
MIFVAFYVYIFYSLIFDYIFKIKISYFFLFLISIFLSNIMFLWEYEYLNISQNYVLIILFSTFPIGFFIFWWIMTFFQKNKRS